VEEEAALGTWPKVSLGDVRIQLIDVKAQIGTGINPSAQKREAREQQKLAAGGAFTAAGDTRRHPHADRRRRSDLQRPVRRLAGKCDHRQGQGQDTQRHRDASRVIPDAPSWIEWPDFLKQRRVTCKPPRQSEQTGSFWKTTRQLNVKAWNAAEQLYDLQVELLSPSRLKNIRSVREH